MKNLILIYTFIATTLSGCFFQADEVTPTGALIKEQTAVEFAKEREANGVKVYEVQISGNQFQLTGKNLKGAKVARLKGPGINIALPIESKEETSLVLDISKNLQLLSNTIFQLIINDAYGATTFQLVLTVQDGAITNAKISDNTIDGKKIASMNASDGDVLTWNNTDTTWEPRSLNGQNFVGTWDSQNNTPQLIDTGYFSGATVNAGDYLIIINSGGGNVTIDGESGWVDGDWIIFNGADWDHVPIAVPTVSTFNGQTGSITFGYGDLDFSSSTINDFADVDTTTFVPTSGQVLKWNGSEWAPSDDNDAGGADSVLSSNITDGTIVDADISNAAGISQGKIAGLVGALNGKLDTVGGGLSGNLNMLNNDIAGVRNASITNLTVTGTMNYISNTTTPAFENNTDSNNRGDALVLLRQRADAGSISGTDFGASLSFEAEGFTNGVTAPQAKVTAGWETTQVDDSNSRDSFLEFKTYQDGSQNPLGMRIDSQGDVGIGTNDPEEKMHLQDNDSNTRIKIVNTNSSAPRYPGVMIDNYQGSNVGGSPLILGRSAQGQDGIPSLVLANDTLMSVAGAGFNGTTGDADNYNQAASITFVAPENFSGTSTPGRIIFGTTESGDTDNPQQRMMINDDGTIVINSFTATTVPDVKLDLNASLMVRGSGSKIYLSSDADQFISADPINDNLTIATSNEERLHIDSDGNIGIGTATPNSKLEILGELTQPISGTVETIDGNSTIVGTATDFSNELSVGQKVLIGSRIYEITGITNAVQMDVTPTPTSADVVSGVTAYEVGNENVFEVLDGEGNSIIAASSVGVTFGKGVSATSASNNDATIITSNADGGSDSIILQSNTSELMEIKATGDIEIGNVNYNQDGIGTVLAIGEASGNTALIMGQDNLNKTKIETNSTGSTLVMGTTSSGTDYNNTMVMTQGTVQINTTTANGRLTVNGAEQTAIYARTTDQNNYQLQLKNDTYNAAADFHVLNNGNLNITVPDDSVSAGEFNLYTDGIIRLNVDNTGLIGIGSGINPDTQLHVKSPTATTDVAKFEREATGAALIAIDSVVGTADITLSPTANGSGTILNYTTSGGVTTNGLILDENGNVGIGVDPTTDKLQVDGSFSSTGAGSIGGALTLDGDITLEDGTAARSISMTDRATGGNAFDFTIKGSDATSAGTGGNINLTPGSGAAAADGRVNISKGNSSGIPAVDAALVLEDDASVKLQLLSPNNVTSSILFGDTDSNNVGQINYEHNNQKLSFVAENNVSITVNGNESFKIDSNGELGIGTTGLPDALVDVESNTPSIHISDDDNNINDNAYSALLEFRDNANFQVGYVGYSSTDQNLSLRNLVTTGSVDLVTNSGNLKLEADGKLAIGSTSPETRVVISGGALCVGSDANCDGNTDIEGHIHASLLCDEQGLNCADVSSGLATDINTLNDAAVKTTSLYFGNGAGGMDNGSATSKNLGVGQNSLTAVNTGVENIGLGYAAADSILGGSYNIAVGVSSLDSITNGDKNIAIGSQALRNVLGGDSNIALGYQAGDVANSGSSNNIFIGENTGPLVAGQVDGSIAIGKDAETNGNSAIAIGVGAIAGLGQTVIGNSSTTDTIVMGQLGVNGQNPAAEIHLNTTIGGVNSGIRWENSGGQFVSQFLSDSTGSTSFNININGSGEANNDFQLLDNGNFLLGVGTGGKVGIGGAPGSNLFAVDSGASDNFTLFDGLNTFVQVNRNDIINDGAIRFQTGGTDDWSMGVLGSSVSNNDFFHLKPNGADTVLTTTPNGFTGIMNINPQTSLHIGTTPTAGGATATNNVLRLEGNSIEDATASNSYDGSFGMLHFYANNDIGGFIERQYVLTNAYQGGSFAILQSTGAIQPTISTTSTAGDTVVNGEAVFSINNSGTVEINSENAAPPSVGLEVNGEIKIKAGSGAGVRFEDGSILTSASGFSAGSVTQTGDSIIEADSDGAGGGDIKFRIGSGGTDSQNVVTMSSSDMTIGNTNNNMNLTINGGGVNATMDATNKTGGSFIATNDNSTVLNMASLASDNGGTTFGVSSNDLTKITTSGANSTGLAIGTESADPIIFGTNSSEAMRIDANQRIAIGRVTADTIFHLATTAADNVDNKLTMILENDEVDVTAGKGAGIEFRAVSNTTGPVISPLGGIKAIRETSVESNERGALVFTTMDGSSNINERLRVDSYGKVGIGTNSPDENLEIEANSGADVPTLRISSTDTDVLDNDTIGAVEFYSNDSTTQGVGAWVRANSEPGTLGSNTQLLFGTGVNGSVSAKVTLDSAGRLAVNESSPTRKLEVTDATGKQLRINYDGSNYVEFDAGATGDFTVSNNGVDRFVFDANGNLGLGGVDPTTKLQIQSTVAGGDTIMRVDADDGGEVFTVTKDANDDGAISIFDTSGNTDIFLNAAGDSYINGLGQFGIGTTAPEIALTVSGPSGTATNANETVRLENGANRLGIGIDTTDDYVWFRAYEESVGDSDIVLQPTGGKVGIGVLNPEAIFEVTNTASPVRFIATENSDTAQATLVLRRERGGNTDNPGTVTPGEFEGTLSFELEGSDGAAPNGDEPFIEAANIGVRWTEQQTNISTDRDSAIVFRTMIDGGALQEQMIIDENGDVGIGTTTPGSKLTIAGATPDTLAIAGTNNSVTLFGDGAAYFQGRDVTNDIEFIMGTSTAGAAFVGSMTNHALHLRTNNNTNMQISTAGNVGIGTTPSTYRLEVESAAAAFAGYIQNTNATGFGLGIKTAGTTNAQYAFDVENGSSSSIFRINNDGSIDAINGATLTSGGVWTDGSDRRYKENIENLSWGKEEFMLLRPVEYNLKKTGDHHMGFVAQEVEQIFPDLVHTNHEGYKSLAYGLLTSILVKMTQEQQLTLEENERMFKTMQGKLEQIEFVNNQQDRQIATLQDKIESLESENQLLKSYLCKKDPDAPFCE